MPSVSGRLVCGVRAWSISVSTPFCTKHKVISDRNKLAQKPVRVSRLEQDLQTHTTTAIILDIQDSQASGDHFFGRVCGPCSVRR